MAGSMRCEKGQGGMAAKVREHEGVLDGARSLWTTLPGLYQSCIMGRNIERNTRCAGCQESEARDCVQMCRFAGHWKRHALSCHHHEARGTPWPSVALFFLTSFSLFPELGFA